VIVRGCNLNFSLNFNLDNIRVRLLLSYIILSYKYIKIKFDCEESIRIMIRYHLSKAHGLVERISQSETHAWVQNSQPTICNEIN